MSIPVFTRATYTNDVESGRYLKDPTIIPCLKLPPWIRIGNTWNAKAKSVGAGMMADGPKKKGVGLHAGLLESGIVDWYVTDIPDIYRGKVCRNTALFHFSTDRRTLTVYLFTGYEKPSIELRVKDAREIIPRLVTNASQQVAA